jgi:hypothetical protein
VLKPFTKHPAAFIAVKAGLEAASIAAAEQMWKDNHRARAVVLMLVTNAMMVGVTAHNAAVLAKRSLGPDLHPTARLSSPR